MPQCNFLCIKPIINEVYSIPNASNKDHVIENVYECIFLKIVPFSSWIIKERNLVLSRCGVLVRSPSSPASVQLMLLMSEGLQLADRSLGALGVWLTSGQAECRVRGDIVLVVYTKENVSIMNEWNKLIFLSKLILILHKYIKEKILQNDFDF